VGAWPTAEGPTIAVVQARQRVRTALDVGDETPSLYALFVLFGAGINATGLNVVAHVSFPLQFFFLSCLAISMPSACHQHAISTPFN
jgi:hypothetical protein